MRLGHQASYRRVVRAMRGLQAGTVVLDEYGFLRAAPQPPFRSGETTRCTACGASHWLVGRRSAECAVCGSPAILATPNTQTHLTKG